MKKINILLLGSGGREHALAWKIKQSEYCHTLYIAPGNAGTALVGTNIHISVNDTKSIREILAEKNIDMLICGPEEPLVNGLRDALYTEIEAGLMFIGPGQLGAQLEGSKHFSKQFMNRYGIPTANANTFSIAESSQAHSYIESMNLPIVLKADGLAAGKGVLICDSYMQAHEELDAILNGKFGLAGKNVLIEQFLTGVELSVFVLTDGNHYILLPEAKDYKRVGENDSGPNTGGMGAVSPVPFADSIFMKKIRDKIIIPTLDGLKTENIIYNGFIFFGLINVNNNPFVIEYNCRMGDPETEVVIPRINSDLVEAFIHTCSGTLNQYEIQFSENFCSTVVLVSEGYPGDYKKGAEIHVPADMPGLPFHAGTSNLESKTVTSGGRVIACTGVGKTMQEALQTSYSLASEIEFKGKKYRKDIGFDLYP